MHPISEILNLLETVRKTAPLVHNITNYVTVNDCANVQLAIGGSPIMSDEIADVKDITKICSALVINIGTLNQRTVAAMHESCRVANENNIPIVLDPVGCGASSMRNQTTMELLNQHQFCAIRGNLSELSYIAGLSSNTKGVDVNEEDSKNDPEKVATMIAHKYGCAVGITGKVDTISDGKRCFKIANGTPMMKQITGTGCMISALTGVFLGAKADGFTALAAAILIMGIAGELAYDKAKPKGTGSLHIGIIDEVSMMTAAKVMEHARIDEKTN